LPSYRCCEVLKLVLRDDQGLPGPFAGCRNDKTHISLLVIVGDTGAAQACHSTTGGAIQLNAEQQHQWCRNTNQGGQLERMCGRCMSACPPSSTRLLRPFATALDILLILQHRALSMTAEPEVLHMIKSNWSCNRPSTPKKTSRPPTTGSACFGQAGARLHRPNEMTDIEALMWACHTQLASSDGMYKHHTLLTRSAGELLVRFTEA
jgi:hypothetical protein